VLTAKEVMTRDVFTLPATLSAREAGWALMHRGVSGAPVRDRHGRIIGVISQSDLALAHVTADDWRDVADVMTPAVLAVGPQDAALDAVHLMIDHGVHRVVVLEDSGALAGIITSRDILRLLVEERVDLPAPKTSTDAGTTDAWPDTWIAALAH
jgi:predicted transcriptional regulator